MVTPRMHLEPRIQRPADQRKQIESARRVYIAHKRSPIPIGRRSSPPSYAAAHRPSSLAPAIREAHPPSIRYAQSLRTTIVPTPLISFPLMATAPTYIRPRTFRSSSVLHPSLRPRHDSPINSPLPRTAAYIHRTEFSTPRTYRTMRLQHLFPVT